MSERMNKAEAIGRWFVKINGLVGIAFLFLLMFITTANVFLRFFLRMPITGIIEIIETLTVLTVFLIIGWTALNKAHVVMDLVSQVLPKKVLKALDVINYFIIIVFSLLIAWQSLLQAQLAKKMNIGTMLLDIPRWPLLIVTAYGFFIICIAAFILLYGLKKENE